MTKLPNRGPPKKAQPPVVQKTAPKKPIDMVFRGDKVALLTNEFNNSTAYNLYKNANFERISRTIEIDIFGQANNDKTVYLDILNKKIQQIKDGEYKIVTEVDTEEDKIVGIYLLNSDL